jgi:hypothetical protein
MYNGSHLDEKTIMRQTMETAALGISISALVLIIWLVFGLAKKIQSMEERLDTAIYTVGYMASKIPTCASPDNPNETRPK